MSFTPCFQFAGPGAVEDVVAAATRSQLHRHRATTVVAELKHWFPKKRFTQRAGNGLLKDLFPYFASQISDKNLTLSWTSTSLNERKQKKKRNNMQVPYMKMYMYLCFSVMGGRLSQLGRGTFEEMASSPADTNLILLLVPVT